MYTQPAVAFLHLILKNKPMKKLLLLLIFAMLPVGCEKTDPVPQNIQDYLNEKSVFEVVTNPDATKIFFLSGVIDENAPPYLCSIPYIYQLSCTDGNSILTFENLYGIRNIAVDNTCNLYACIGPDLIKFTPPHDSISIRRISSGFTSVAVDNNGNVWAGTWDEGLYSYSGITWKHYTPENSILPDTYIADVMSADNVTWVILSDEDFSVIRIDGTDWKIYKISELSVSENSYLNSCTVDPAGTAYISFRSDQNTYIYKLNTEGISNLNLPENIRNSYISKMKTDLNGNVYFVVNQSGIGKIYCLKSGNWFRVQFSEEIEAISDIAIDVSDNLWIGTNNGVKKMLVILNHL